MIKKVFPLLCMLMLGLSGCMEKGDNIQSYSNVPAIFEYSSTFQPAIKTSIGTFLAPELADDLLYDKDALWTYFEINYDNQSSSEYTTVTSLQYIKVDRGSAYSTPGGESETGDYPYKINSVAIGDLVDNLLFLALEHTAPNDQTFEYEMTYDSEDEADEVPTVFIRARQKNTGTKSEATFDYPFAFDMSSFFSRYKDSENTVKFNIMYKTGVDEDGKDVYADWGGNPLTVLVN